MTDESTLKAALAYIHAVQTSTDGQSLKAHLHPEFTLREWPNALAPDGAVRDRDGVVEAVSQGQEVVAEQRFEVLRSVVDGSSVVLEMEWSAILLMDVLDWPSGHRLRARTATILEVCDGQILSQHSYDSYLPADG